MARPAFASGLAFISASRPAAGAGAYDPPWLSGRIVVRRSSWKVLAKGLLSSFPITAALA
jgi:hypothetical protein